MEETRQYITFFTTTSSGENVEMAVLEEFEFEKSNYVAAALIEGDTINEEGIYLYKVKADKEEFAVEKLRNKYEYDKISRAYMELIDSAEDSDDNL